MDTARSTVIASPSRSEGEPRRSACRSSTKGVGNLKARCPCDLMLRRASEETFASCWKELSWFQTNLLKISGQIQTPFKTHASCRRIVLTSKVGPGSPLTGVR